MKNTVSVITVTFNAEEYLEETILSVINQTYEGIEYIIIDGGSTDKTVDIIKKYEDKIDYWVSEKDFGIYDAMNKGILAAKGEWLNFLNGGDRYYNKDILSDIFGTENMTQYDVIYGDCYLVGRDNKPLRLLKAELLDTESIKKGMIVNHQAIFIKKEKTPFYDLQYKYKAEWNWLIDVLYNKTIKSFYMNLPFVYYKLGGYSQQGFNENFKEYLQVMRSRFGVFQILKNSLHLMRVYAGTHLRKLLDVDTLRK